MPGMLRTSGTACAFLAGTVPASTYRPPLWLQCCASDRALFTHHATCGFPSLQLWERYCGWQRLPEAAAAAGAELLRGLLAGGSGLGEGLEQRHTSIEFRAVEVEGYFR